MEDGKQDTANARVFVLVLNWNRLDFTTACYRSLKELDTAAELHLLVIDNGSTVHTPEDLRHGCPDAEILALPENKGFAGGMNEGIRVALREGADFVWLLNNDTVCERTALSTLLAPMADPEVGIVSSRLTQASLGPAPGEIRKTSLIHRGGSSMKPPFYIPFPPREGSRPDYLCGASLLIRAEVIRRIGPLDEGFPFFFEDADYSFRARRDGWRLAETERADVMHVGSATIGRMNRQKAYYYRLGHLRFLRRHASFPLLASLPALLWRLFVDACHLDGPALSGTLAGWARGWRGGIGIKGA